MKDNRVFIDTNVWIYSLTESKVSKEGVKREISLNLLERLVCIDNTAIYVSIQVINECHWNLVRKFKVPDTLAAATILENIIPIAEVMGIDVDTYTLSNHIRKRYKCSFWDSLIIASALEAGCSILYTEDMQNGQIIEGKLKIVNPFEEK